ncbi:vacuolar protein sorting-associated protein 9A-like [Pyrus ussuriensis x Pyrus communis]|uniref:Vacuolar protein sorting-associated protein 9A-like n=1 Tax=Pyrus ussuriensis x Pyrus communis TaxID=2448454 RepID=A0A5N5GPW8_9ROSA|nr:vacuolar protein sorting-associated protein 9A-like [Pyrus ussuriensis x Pyrus communis]
MENTDVFLGLQDFLERMRQPSAADLVKSIKSFIVSFSNNAPDPERDSAAVQDFFARMEIDFRAHPLWAGCSEEELDGAGEGLEKYVMTKLFPRVFASLPDDVKLDEQLYEKMALVQQFIRPENLDIKPTFQNETSWLLAQKELQKINMYKAPRDKLVCILNCCKVINNLLMKASVASNENPPGADEFLPVLIYVTLKANPPQLHLNLLYIQRYRRQSRLVGEASYFFTNMLSVESFISNIDANAISMDESEYDKNMETARALLSGLSADLDSQYSQKGQFAGYGHRSESLETRHQHPNANMDPVAQSRSSETNSRGKKIPNEKDNSPFSKIPSLSDLENKGATILVTNDQENQVFREYPYLFANAGDLTINDVEDLLNNYKQLAFKYVCLSKGLGVTAPSLPSYNSHTEFHQHTETAKQQELSRAIEPNDETSNDTDTMDDALKKEPLTDDQILESRLSQDQEVSPQSGTHEEYSQ